jgi:hypothetical protein
MMPTDTERLDWLAHKGCVELEHEYLGPVTVTSGFDKLGSGRNLRAALDAAMKNEKRKAARAAKGKP